MNRYRHLSQIPQIELIQKVRPGLPMFHVYRKYGRWVATVGSYPGCKFLNGTANGYGVSPFEASANLLAQLDKAARDIYLSFVKLT